MILDVPNNSSFLTWQDCMKSYISNMEELTVLETGIGKGSEFLVNNFKRVYSFESNWDDEWYNLCVKVKDDKWSTQYFDLNQKSLYIDSLNEFVDLNKIDIALVDHACKGDNHRDKCRRGDITKYFMEVGIPHIFVHDYPSGNYFWDIPNNSALELGYNNMPHSNKTGYFKKQIND